MSIAPDLGPICYPPVHVLAEQTLFVHQDMPLVIPVTIDDLATIQEQASELVTVMNDGLALFTGTTSIWVNPVGGTTHALVWTPAQPLEPGSYDVTVATTDDSLMCDSFESRLLKVLDEELGEWPQVRLSEIRVVEEAVTQNVCCPTGERLCVGDLCRGCIQGIVDYQLEMSYMFTNPGAMQYTYFEVVDLNSCHRHAPPFNEEQQYYSNVVQAFSGEECVTVVATSIADGRQSTVTRCINSDDIVRIEHEPFLTESACVPVEDDEELMDALDTSDFGSSDDDCSCSIHASAQDSSHSTMGAILLMLLLGLCVRRHKPSV
ncbi:MAG: hypothetical protein RBU37_08240 [Myxococcota bacterium]|jgi:hypothetical protein|nr:hypothetical protein [Myxococcota bacterium]